MLVVVVVVSNKDCTIEMTAARKQESKCSAARGEVEDKLEMPALAPGQEPNLNAGRPWAASTVTLSIRVRDIYEHYQRQANLT